MVEWSDNVKISDKAPKTYAPEMEKRFTATELQQMYAWHGLPERWRELDCPTFIDERKKRMALVIKVGFEKL